MGAGGAGQAASGGPRTGLQRTQGGGPQEAAGSSWQLYVLTTHTHMVPNHEHGLVIRILSEDCH